jgi:serpin B
MVRATHSRRRIPWFVISAAIVSLISGAVASARPLSAASSEASPSREVKAVVSANNRFAFDLYSELGESDGGNLFYSPYSVSTALAMTYEGARGKTAREMRSALHFPKIKTLRKGSAAIQKGLNKTNGMYKLKTGNALWVQKRFRLLKKYRSVVKKYYKGKAARLDFVKPAERERSRQTINRYIARHTAQKIKELIPAGAIDEWLRLVLTNAIYFKGFWKYPFDPAFTFDGDFRITPDQVVKTPMMYMTPPEEDPECLNYFGNDELQILELPYKGGKLSMVVILPREDLSSISSSLTANDLTEFEAQMKPTYVEYVIVPKFEFATGYRLNKTLKGMGMQKAFSNKADFSGMTGKLNLKISFVFHSAFVSVDEKGTEAAAATVVGGSSLTSLHVTPIFVADHPFVFLIRENKTGNILFFGQVVDPTKS